LPWSSGSSTALVSESRIMTRSYPPQRRSGAWLLAARARLGIYLKLQVIRLTPQVKSWRRRGSVSIL